MLKQILSGISSYASRLQKFNREQGAAFDSRLTELAREQGASLQQTWDALRAQFIGHGAQFYISRFDTKGVHFHAAAMLGPFWLAWRRMYRDAVIASFWIGFFWVFLALVAPQRLGAGGLTSGNVLFLLFLVGNLIVTGFTGIARYKLFGQLKLGEMTARASSFDSVSKEAYARGRTSVAALLLVPLVVACGWIAGAMAANTYTNFRYGADVEAAKRLAEDLLERRAAAPTGSCRIILAETKVAFVPSDDLFGHEIVATLESVGGPGVYTVRAVLNSSDGSFERAQQYAMDAGKPVKLTFTFPETRWGSTNIQGQVFCGP